MLRRSLLLALAACALGAAPAAASPALDVGISDDRVLFEGSDAEAYAAVTEWKALGVDTVRIHARWVAHVRGDVMSREAPQGLDRRDPDGGVYHWERLDRAVDTVRAAGMEPVLTVTGSGPLWGSLDPSQGSPRYKPSPTLFAEFATAVARRYGGRVDEYILWNEPNHELWLQPQNVCTRTRRCRPYAPHLYRRIVRAAEPAVRAEDPGARVLMGALAPRGTSGRSRNARLRPLAFIRAMGCVSSRYRRVRSGDCRGFRPASSYGFAYHPHGVRMRPTQRSRRADEAQMGDLGRLVRALDRTTRANGFRPRHPSGRFPLYLTEYGYETSPPDRRRGVSNARQSAYLQQAAYLAWRHPRVRSLVQYAWKDEALRRGGAGWQSGLRRHDGRPKGALTTFRHPFWAVRRSARVVRLWGQVRPGDATTVRIERRSASDRWVRVATQRTDRRGFFRRDLRRRSGGVFRFRYDGGTSSTRRVR